MNFHSVNTDMNTSWNCVRVRDDANTAFPGGVAKFVGILQWPMS